MEIRAAIAPLLALILGFVLSFGLVGDVDGGVTVATEDGRAAFRVQIDYMAPEYKGGDKFRSPATIDTALAENLARRLQRSLLTVAAGRAAGDDDSVDAGNGARADADEALRLTALHDTAAVPQTMTVVPVHYRTVPMAIMRVDTTIVGWEQMKGHRVCVTAGGIHVGTVAGRHGAIEMVHPSLTDALVALRSGDCDALVHDSALLEALIRFPEWKKFSARLRGNRRSALAFLVPAQDVATIATLRRVVAEWRGNGYPEELVLKMARDIAFEVYLEQEVPDCH